MQWVLRRLGPREVDYELAIGVLFVPMCVVVACLLARLPPRAEPICVLHALSGYPCPTCGTLRCIRYAIGGRLIQAFVTQPFVATGMATAALYALYSWIVVLGRLPRVRVAQVSRRQAWGICGSIVTAFLVNWVYLFLVGR